jgi:DNA-binding LytR/AlgR family response regulator
MMAVNKVYNDIQEKQPEAGQKDYIFVKTEYRIENIPLNDILYIEGMQGYLRIHSAGRRIMTKQSFKTILEQLPKEQFIQVHKSWVVSIPKIESIERSRIKIGNKLIPVGESYKNSFFARIKN